MSRQYDHVRLTPAELSAGLDQAGLSIADFERLTGANRKTVMCWLRPASDPKHIDPPFWVSSWLALYLLPGARSCADQVAAYLLMEIDHDAA